MVNYQIHKVKIVKYSVWGGGDEAGNKDVIKVKKLSEGLGPEDCEEMGVPLII